MSEWKNDPLAGLRCPLDQQPLSRKGNGLCCTSGHQFDCAKFGYVNLLPVQNKRSRDPGDSKAMVAARRLFLESGAYQPVADALLDAVDLCADGRPVRLLDAGCGEGYYLSYLVDALTAKGVTLQAQGLDISKWAIQAASKRRQAVGWLVGSNAALPLADQQLDRLLCLFGFPMFDEFARTLKPGGLLHLADPGENHLIELRRVLYPEIRAPRPYRSPSHLHFESLNQQSVQFSLCLDSEAKIQQLLAMTPHLHRAPRAGREAVAALRALTLSVDVQIRSYRRTHIPL